MKGRALTLSDGSRIEGVDVILMGTGYRAPKHNPNLGLRCAFVVFALRLCVMLCVDWLGQTGRDVRAHPTPFPLPFNTRPTNQPNIPPKKTSPHPQ